MTVFDNEAFLRKQIIVLESANETLKAKVLELKKENAELKLEIESLCRRLENGPALVVGFPSSKYRIRGENNE